MARNIAIQYDSGEVTKNEIILTMKNEAIFWRIGFILIR